MFDSHNAKDVDEVTSHKAFLKNAVSVGNRVEVVIEVEGGGWV